MKMDFECCEVPQCSQPVMMLDGDRLIEIASMDWCVVPEVRELWKLGVKTICSCCGHGQDEKAYIRVRGESTEIMRELGYEPYPMHECEFNENTVAFKAKTVPETRAKGLPKDDRTIEEIRESWKPKGVKLLCLT